jgi:hypothetical protein
VVEGKFDKDDAFAGYTRLVSGHDVMFLVDLTVQSTAAPARLPYQR